MHSRRYASPDRPGCLGVFDSNVPRYFTDRERTDFELFLDALPGPYLVLVDEAGAVVACGGYAIRPEAGVADLCWGMVHGQRHGNGLGRILTELRIEEAAADPSVHTLELNTSQLTTGFYERLGFEITKVTPDAYGPGMDRCDMCRLVDQDGDGDGAGR